MNVSRVNAVVRAAGTAQVNGVPESRDGAPESRA